MKKIIITLAFFISILAYTQVQQASVSVSPSDFRIDEEITITISGVDPELWNVGQPGNIYLWAWYTNLNGANSTPDINGGWADSINERQLTNNNNGTYSYTFTPSTLYEGATDILSINFLVKADDGSGDKKSQDLSIYPIYNYLSRTAPSKYISVVDSGTLVNISATSSETSGFTLRANGNIVNTANEITDYSFDYTVNQDTNFELEANDGHTILTESFKVNLTPLNPVPDGMKDGLNLDPNDNTKATLVLYAPGKSTVHAIGDFNNWQISNSYLMNHDTARDRFWIQLTGLSAGNHMYQYVVDNTIKIADPYSTTILDPDHDEAISDTTYPNRSGYPVGQTKAVSLFITNQTDYNWQVVNFQKPAKTDLVVYEILIRDFDAPHSFDAVKSRLDYLEGLGINAIELMPVSEFDGNNSWGYNPSFHMALDKYYGTATAFKELIDECHSRGIAVILDVVYNHGTGQHPFYQMWNTDGGGTGGVASNDNPFFNASAKHAYNVFNDFNHQSYATQEYVEHTVKYWIEEFKIDGFRWDLTKGFTQNCASGDGGCTDRLQLDRVNILKKYADYQWEVDPNFYIIFEHLGTIHEEKLWADYRSNEGKGIMLWNNLNGVYNEATMGYHDSNKSDFSNVSYIHKGFDTPAAVSYMESHDEERQMYRILRYGNTSGYNVKSPATNALGRMEIAGAFFFTVPGPKMIWQFGELGYEISIMSCDGGAPPETYPDNDSCKLNEKPDGWNFLANQSRTAIYDTWARLIDLKLREPIFKTGDLSMDLSNDNGLKSIHLTLSSPPTDAIGHIAVLGNFGVTAQNINTNFQTTGTWYDLMDASGNTTINGATTSINLQPGEFKIYGNKPSTLSVDESFFETNELKAYPNPLRNSFQINKAVETISIFNLTGKEVKSFKGTFNKGHSFDISNLPQSIYIVKINSKLGAQETLKIVKL
ncbi:alpha-amylase family glycosyl hydrolase [Seonamhaeicola maritimus]|uniref:alpha-amylase family glycosyl hydrolase n=1 Tax=Seonamhaeicola maritimus TaxID=2591822 RepID=UPI0024955CD8|nr:alpha-amylase family glycosyl hydrolase [Seonamhaeicola maritimus]